MMRAARRKLDGCVLLAQTRQYVTPLRVDFSEDVSLPKTGASGPSCAEEWAAKKSSTEQLLALLQTYKDLGDSNAEPLLKHHNPRTFEDLKAPVPNFRSMNIKAGDVPKFFDSVLSSRADDAVAAKTKWWAARKAEAEAAAAAKQAAGVSPLPLPKWEFGKSVSLEQLKAVTDAQIHALEPARKLALPVVPPEVQASLSSFAASLGQGTTAPALVDSMAATLAEKAVVTEDGKVLEEFKFIPKALAAKVVAARRAEVHERYLKMWSKKLLVCPETAAVPLKEVDYQLASKFEAVAPKYAEVLQAAAAGSSTLGERMRNHPALESFLLKREKDAIAEDFPASEADKEGAALAAQLEDPQVALSLLLGPELSALGSSSTPLSVQVRAITAHRYAPERFLYKEGMKLAAKLEEEEAALKEELKAVYGPDVDVARFQSSPRTPAQQLADRLKELSLHAAELKAEAEAAPNAFLQHAVTKKQEVMLNPANLAFEEVQYPQVVEEMMHIELDELKEEESKIADAEEEELWMLTLAAQSKHLAKHFGVDLPHSVIAHMDPLLIKKVDWETTNGLEDWDITLDDMGAEYAKEQWAVESLSHHFLPLIRYRRMKARQQGKLFLNEQC